MKTHDEMIRDLYARRDAYEMQKQKQKRKIKRTAVRLSCIAACFAVCLTVGLGVYQETKAPDEKTESSETTQQTPSDSAGESEDDEWWNESRDNTHGAHAPSLLQAMYSKRIAIVEITEINEEAIVKTPLATFAKLGCKVLYEHREVYPLDTAGFVLMFEEEAKKISVGDKILFVPMPICYEDKTGYGPTVNSDDITEYLLFSGDKLLFEEEMLLNKSFQTIYHFNSMCRKCHEWYVLKGLEEDKVYNLRNVFRSGMTVEETQVYFEEIDRLYREVKGFEAP